MVAMIAKMTKKMDWLCLLATGLFVASNTLRAIFLSSFHNRMHWDEDRRKSFDAGYIQQEWEWKVGYRPLEVASGTLNAIAWFFLSVPILQVAWLQSAKGHVSPALHIMVCMLAVGGALTEFISQILILGATNALEWIALEFELHTWISDAGDGENDGIGYRVLELVHLTTKGMTMWVGAMEWLFLCAIFLLLFVSIAQSQNKHHHQPPTASDANHITTHPTIFGMRWGVFGLVLALFFAAEFVTSLIRFESFGKLSGLARFVSFLNRFLLFPAWLLWLGRQLAVAVEEEKIREAAVQRSRVVKIYDGKSGVNTGQVLAFSHNSLTGEWDMPDNEAARPGTPDMTNSSSHEAEENLEEVRFF